MVREISELEQLDKEDSSGLKKHDEILELIKEIESIEDKFKYLEVTPESHIGQGILNQEFEQTEATGGLKKKPNISVDKTTSELKDITRQDKRKDRIKKIRFPIEIQWRKKVRWQKIGNFLQRRKVNPNGIETPELTELQNQLDSSKTWLRPVNTTFTLKIDDQGMLVGYNIKKLKSKGGHGRILPFGKKATGEQVAKEADEPGIKGKIKGLFSRIKTKQPGESSDSKVSSLMGKIKAVLPKK